MGAPGRLNVLGISKLSIFTNISRKLCINSSIMQKDNSPSYWISVCGSHRLHILIGQKFSKKISFWGLTTKRVCASLFVLFEVGDGSELDWVSYTITKNQVKL